jgi:uncharacterized protein YlzI (FlbEa/FlbD family)
MITLVRFILTTGQATNVNPDAVKRIAMWPVETTIFFIDGTSVSVVESYDTVRKLLTQGYE